MTIRRLPNRVIRKPWGRRDLEPPFGVRGGGKEPVGEIWFEDGSEAEQPLLVKFLFTSEKLSIQVHPGDEAAKRAGYKCGKDEAWLVLAAEPGAVIGLGLRGKISRTQLRAAALDGSIEGMVDWRPVSAGDIFYSPAGTVHALGPGLTVVEIQQNVDVTYRLYDYGRPRELHLAEGVAAAIPGPCPDSFRPSSLDRHRALVASGSFQMERWTGPGAMDINCEAGRPVLLVPLSGRASCGAELLRPGSVWTVEDRTAIRLESGAELLCAYPGREVMGSLLAAA